MPDDTRPYDDEPAIELANPTSETGKPAELAPAADGKTSTPAAPVQAVAADAGTDAQATVPTVPTAPVVAPSVPVAPTKPALLWYEQRQVEVTIAAQAKKNITQPFVGPVWCSSMYAKNGLATQTWTFVRTDLGVSLERKGFAPILGRQVSGRHLFMPTDQGSFPGQFLVDLESEKSFVVEYQNNGEPTDETDKLLGVQCTNVTFPVTAKWL